jgi:hypothetical protein
MTLVDHNLAICAQLVGEIGPAGESLQGGDVDDTGELGAAAAELPWLGAEQVVDLTTPLVGERLAVHQYERGDGAAGDDGASHHGLPGAGRSDQQTQLVSEQGLHSFFLLGLQVDAGREFQCISGDSPVVDLDLAAGLLDEPGDHVTQSARGHALDGGRFGRV